MNGLEGRITDPHASQSNNQRTTVLVVSSLANFFMASMAPALNVALPAISRDLGSDTIHLSWMVTAFVLGIAVFCLPFGRLADIIGIKRVFLWGMVLYTVSSTAAAFSVSSTMLIACRAAQGISAGMVVGSSMALITAVYPREERGRALGLNIALIYAGSSTGPFLGGILTDHLGWPSIFLMNTPTGLLVIALIIWKIKGDWSECKGEKFDYTGSAIYGLALIILMYGFSILPEIGGGILIAAGVIGVLAFLIWESRVESPVLDVRLFRSNRAFVFANLAHLVMYSSVFGVAFLVSLYLEYIKGLPAELAGLVLVTQPAMQAMLSYVTGKLSERTEPRIVASAGMALTTVALVLLSLLSESSSIIQVIGTLMILGIGFSLFSSPNVNAIMSSVEPKFLGVASATTATMRAIGQMLSMGITMILIALIIGRVIITPEHYAAFLVTAKTAVAIFATLCFGGIFASLSRGKAR